jgi:DNA-binding CsgD family transcriptional regulator
MRNLGVIRGGGQSDGRLSPRELEVAELAVLARNEDIAVALGISVCTVRAHLANVARKTGLEGRAAIAVWADRLSRDAA